MAKTIRDVMTKNPRTVSVDPDQGLDDALEMMAEHQVMARHAGAKRTGEVVEQISS